MKEIPILFSTLMVQALLAGRKTVTRRIVKPKTPEQFTCLMNMEAMPGTDRAKRCQEEMVRCSSPYGKPGDLLWVRESWNTLSAFTRKPDYSVMNIDDFVYRADDDRIDKWKPSIHMPKEASRIWLRVEEVRVERLHDISEEDAIEEGIEYVVSDILRGYRGYDDKPKWMTEYIVDTAKESFETLWHKINGVESWDADPWVWVVRFKVISITGKPDVVSKNTSLTS